MVDALVVEIETEDGTVGVAAGAGRAPAAWLIRHHFSCFLVGEDARNLNVLWDQLYRASLRTAAKPLRLRGRPAAQLRVLARAALPSARRFRS